MYISGGELSGLGWLCLIAMAYLIGAYLFQSAFSGLHLSYSKLAEPVFYIFIFGIPFLVIRGIYLVIRSLFIKPKPPIKR